MAIKVSDNRMITPSGVEFRSGDVIRVTGYCASHSRRIENYVGMVDTISKDGYFKTWPDEKNAEYSALTDREKYDGKLWFELTKVESLEVLQKGDFWSPEDFGWEE